MQKRLLKTKRQLTKYLVKNTGQPLEKIEKDVEEIILCSAEEAYAYGIIDEILYKRK